MLALSIGWLFQLNSSLTTGKVALAFVAFVVRLLTTLSYWRGKNWARVLAVFYSIFCLVRLWQWNKVTMLTRELWMSEAALAVFLLVYLNQGDVAAWFKGTKPAPTTVPIEDPLLSAADDVDREPSGVLE